jgi:hypothetical protein
MRPSAIALFLALALVTGGCVTHRMPRSHPNVTVNLSKSEIQSMTEVSGSGSSFGIFPMSIYGLTPLLAMHSATYKATKAAYEQSSADFLLQPRAKVTHYNFLLFDFAKAEVIGKAVKLKGW